MKERVLCWGGVILGIEFFSAMVIREPIWNGLIAAALAVVLFVLVLTRPSWALSLLFIEYLIGSKGALFKLGGDENNNGGISLRILFFAAFFLGWLIFCLRYRTWREWREWVRGRAIYGWLAVMVVYAVVVGFLRGNHAYLFQDVNAWGMWLLLIPVLDITSHERDKLKIEVLPALVAACLWLPLKTLGLFYLFSHRFGDVTSSLYLWVRRTGAGEITRLGGDWYRIFFQSHLYAVFVWLFLWAWLAFGGKRKRWIFVLLILSAAELLLSLSRSLWLGWGFGGGMLLGLFFWQRRMIPWSALRTAVVAGVGSLLLIVGIAYFPWPARPQSSLADFFLSRADLSERAALSRWELFGVLWEKIQEHPVLGSGFGATVTYESKDPRIIATTGGGYTTYAFEWGWLEHWIKFGLLGIPLMLAILWSLGRRLWVSGLPHWIRFAAVSSLVSLAVIHMFSPYLNHPLGIFALFAGEVLLIMKKQNAS